MPGFPPCPHLPPLRPGLDWQHLNIHRDGPRGGEFYLSCLEYAQVLWCQGRAARALLCLDRALGADLDGSESLLRQWPPPYEAMAWIMRQTPPDVFLGNPRVHFQHYAGRMNGPRREERRWRAWACWALARAVHPTLPGDPRHAVDEPSVDEIAGHLRARGFPGEDAVFKKTLESLR